MSEISRAQPWLGTFVEIYINADTAQDEIASISQAGFDKIAHIHKLMSYHESDSELSKINQNAASTKVQISPHMQRVMTLALDLSKRSDGRFDVSIAPELIQKGYLPNTIARPENPGDWRDIELFPNEIRFNKPLLLDLGGIAKGYAVDLAFDCMHEMIPDAHQISVNAGGDLRVLRWEGEQAQIKYLDIMSRSRYTPTPMLAPAMASSGLYPRGGDNHLVFLSTDKRKRPRRNVITVFASSSMMADALTKVAYLADDYLALVREFGGIALATNWTGRAKVMS